MGYGYDIPPNMDRAAVVDIWIPHATNRDRFQGHHMWIEIPWGTVKYALWQAAQSDGDWVRYNDRRVFQDPGWHVPGFAHVEGNRFLTIYSNRIEMSPIAQVRGFKPRRSKH
jgi:hypothetical protein